MAPSFPGVQWETRRLEDGSTIVWAIAHGEERRAVIQAFPKHWNPSIMVEATGAVMQLLADQLRTLDPKFKRLSWWRR